jgi:hypothetical protein
MAFSIIGGAGRTFGRYSSLVMNFRKYSPGYLTFWGRSLSESSNGHRNETGLYTSFTTERRKRYRFFTFLDLYLVPEESYRHEAGLHGAEFRASYSTWLDRKNEIRWTSRLEWRNQQPGDPLNHLLTHKQQLLTYYAVPTGRIMLRFQYNGRFTSLYESGWLTAVEKRFELDYSSVSLFICYFNTSSFYTREFVYERDVWGSFSLPSYFNRGIRALLFYRWRHDNTTLWLRAGLTHTSGKQLKGEIKLQVKYHI